MKMKSIEAKTIITKSKLPDTDYVVNPYIGCQFGCDYCYASFMGRFINEDISAWGDYVYVKSNAAELFAKEIISLAKKKTPPSILLSSVTDPYHAPESKYQLTRKILQSFVDIKYAGKISILTKSPSILRDIDLLKSLNNLEVGMTITTLDDAIGATLENKAPLNSKRLDTLQKLGQVGINTYAFVGPLLPHLSNNLSLLDQLFQEIAKVGVSSIFVEHMNLSPYIKNRLLENLELKNHSDIDVYKKSNNFKSNKEIIDSSIKQLLDKYQLKLRLNQVIQHNVTLF